MKKLRTFVQEAYFIVTGIIILNFNNSSQTLNCLESLYAHCKGGNFRICVVDNASGAEHLGVLEEGLKAFSGQAAPPHLIVAEHNDGYASGNDIGCRYFEAMDEVDNILILNDDTLFTMDIITPMEEYLASHPECGVVFPMVKAPDGSIDRACARRQKSARDLVLQATSLGRFGIGRKEFLPTEGLENLDELRTEVPPGSCMMLPKDVFQRIGWLDPNTFLYFEEHILAEKLRKEGRTCVLLPQIQITHLGAGTTRKQPSKAIYRHWRNSYIYFLKTYSGMPSPLVRCLQFRTWLKSVI